VFRLGLLGLRAACRCADGIGEPTKLLPAYLAKLKSNDPRDFIPAVYRGAWDKAAIASLAPIVLEHAITGDAAARAIFDAETHELARTIAGAIANGHLPRQGVPIALTGGLVLNSVSYRERLLEQLQTFGITPGPVGLVEDPALGAVVLARKLMGERSVTTQS
jgi:N-acetylglucosamine kinase-like BadF-type ATPase